jgi:UDP-glucuronate 4-epimerase
MIDLKIIKNRKVLITGSAGFVGMNLVKRLVDYGCDIVGLDNLNNYYDLDLKLGRLRNCGITEINIEVGKLLNSTQHPNYRFIKLDLLDSSGLKCLFQEERFDTVFHFAAQAGVRYSISNPAEYIESNLVGFFNIIDIAKQFGVYHFIYASSSSVYGNLTDVPFSEDLNVDRPESLYAATKKSNELVAHTYSTIYNMSTVGLRFFTVYGPWGRPDMAYFSFTEKILRNENLMLFNYGNLQRDFTFIDDIIDGILTIYLDKVRSSYVKYDIFNIGNNSPVQLIKFVETLEEVIGKVALKKSVEMQVGDVNCTFADISKLRQLGYNPKVKLEEGLRLFYDWYKKFYPSI